MEGQQFVSPDLYAQQVAQASGGAMPAAGMAPYPLYGIPPLGQAATPPAGGEAEVPVYRRNWFWALVGAGTVGAAWAYFGWYKGRGVTANRGGWSQLPSGVWELKDGEESVVRIFGGGDSWEWFADYHPQGGRYRSQSGEGKTLDAAKRSAEQWVRRASSGAA